jgi:hypothetical protein
MSATDEQMQQVDASVGLRGTARHATVASKVKSMRASAHPQHGLFSGRIEEEYLWREKLWAKRLRYVCSMRARCGREISWGCLKRGKFDVSRGSNG